MLLCSSELKVSQKQLIAGDRLVMPSVVLYNLSMYQTSLRGGDGRFEGNIGYV